MQITINIRYTGKNNSIKCFLKEMKDSGIVDAIRAEEGNLRFAPRRKSRGTFLHSVFI